ncbi:MAG: hypothetical protein ACRD3B_19330, partial [Candidatus Sulfotelmatobacter sp.]
MNFDSIKRLPRDLGKLVLLLVAVLPCDFTAWCQQTPSNNAARSALAGPQGIGLLSSGPQPMQLAPGSISGTVVDESGMNIAGADIKLVQKGES